MSTLSITCDDINEDGGISVTVSNLKKEVFVYYSKRGRYISVCVKNASNKAWGRGGHTVASLEEAASKYKANETKEMVLLAGKEITKIRNIWEAIS